MSAFWSTFLGALADGVLTVAGRLLVGWWQTDRADDIPRRIRRDERRELGPLALKAKAGISYDRLVGIRKTAQGHADH